ncbi:Bypass of stop codon-like protein 5 [Elsinoe fawcettii]|nr:Bypass of stop codon-like protein 5 [Elsinoe fawcettii]
MNPALSTPAALKEIRNHEKASTAAPASSSFEQSSIPLDNLEHGTTPNNETAVTLPLEKWNTPVNLPRTLAAFYSLGIDGLNAGTYGAVIPYLERHYGISYTVVSLVFLSPTVGFTISALCNASIHSHFGQRGVAILTAACHMISFLMAALHPPFPVLIIAYLIGGFGDGLCDAAWNAWIGGMANPNQMLGFLHAWWGANAMIAPLCASALIVRGGLDWWIWYYVMLGLGALQLAGGTLAFWRADGKAYRESHMRTTDRQGSRLREALFAKGIARVTWLVALFLLGYVGVEVALGGWIVVFMTRVRAGDPFDAGVVATGFWLGITVGRLVLGFVTPRLGETKSIMIYLPLAAGLQLVFWLVPSFAVSAVAIALQGFFLGPMYPAAVVACTKLLPKYLHVSAIGFASAFGGSGGAIFPFAVGALAQVKGVQVLQPIVLALLVIILLLWIGIPKIEKKAH